MVPCHGSAAHKGRSGVPETAASASNGPTQLLSHERERQEHERHCEPRYQ